MREKRSTIRIPVGVEGTYEVLQDLHPPRTGLTRDISLGGMRFHSPEPIVPGNRVRFLFTLPQEGQVTMTGVVLWSREMPYTGQPGYESGLRWTEIAPSSQARLNAFLTGYSRGTPELISFSRRFVPPIVWPRAIGLALLGFGLLVVAVNVVAYWSGLSAERRSLQSIVQMYRQIIETYLRPF